MITGINHLAHVVPNLEVAVELLFDAKYAFSDFKIKQLPTRRVTVELVHPGEEGFRRFMDQLGLQGYVTVNRQCLTYNLGQHEQIVLETKHVEKPEIQELQMGYSGMYIKEEKAISEQNSCIVVVGFLNPLTKEKMAFPTYELIEPMDTGKENDGIAKFLKKYPTGRKHHLALSTNSIEEEIKRHGEHNFIKNKLTGKIINTGVHDTKTAFFNIQYTAGLLVELVQ